MKNEFKVQLPHNVGYFIFCSFLRYYCANLARLYVTQERVGEAVLIKASLLGLSFFRNVLG